MQRGRGGFSRQNQSEESAREKAIRSIFGKHSVFAMTGMCIICMYTWLVANIAFETNEEQLKSVLAEVGPVVNLKCVPRP